MQLISYRALAKMRLKDFLPIDTETEIEESGMIVGTGLGGYERFGETIFGWRQNEEFQTAEIDLDLQPNGELPMDVARQILEELQLPVHRGMRAAELIEIFGTPVSDKAGRPGLRLLRFICGDTDQYYLCCDVEGENGLTGVFLGRKDYIDEDSSI